jgi:hypothetical protein
MNKRSFFCGEALGSDPEQPDISSSAYVKQADKLLFTLLTRTHPDGAPMPPSEEQGMQTLELKDSDGIWEAIGLVALPFRRWPNVRNPEAVGMIQFCEPVAPESTLQAVHQIGLISYPDRTLEVCRGLMMIDAEVTRAPETLDMETLEPKDIKVVRKVIASAEPKQIELY